MILFERFLEWIHIKITRNPIKLEWYISIETRQAIIDAASVFGFEYIEMGELKYTSIPTGNPIRDKFEDAVGRLVLAIEKTAIEDENQLKFNFTPSIYTRLDAYLKVDGIQKEDKLYVIKRLKNQLSEVYRKQNMHDLFGG